MATPDQSDQVTKQKECENNETEPQANFEDGQVTYQQQHIFMGYRRLMLSMDYFHGQWVVLSKCKQCHFLQVKMNFWSLINSTLLYYTRSAVINILERLLL